MGEPNFVMVREGGGGVLKTIATLVITGLFGFGGGYAYNSYSKRSSLNPKLKRGDDGDKPLRREEDE